MAESSDGQEKSELPSDKRVREAREKGQVARSKELGTVLVLIMAAAMFLIIGEEMLGQFLQLLSGLLSPSREMAFDTTLLLKYFLDTVEATLWIFAPFFAAMVVAAIVSGIVMSGWNFSAQAMAFKFEKMNPIKGIGRIFSIQGLVELLKAMAKFLLVAVVAVLLLGSQVDQFLGLGQEPLDQGLAHLGSMLSWTFLWVSSVLIIVAAVDVPFQLWNHQKELKMTKQEVKEEGKQSEGNPEVKGRQRQIQREMAMQRMMESVPDADVVITNPTHYAVALKYETSGMSAPTVVASGIELIAAQIRNLAEENHVAIVEAPPLARALYYSTEIGDAIPEGLFKAVAQVLAYIFNLRDNGGYPESNKDPFADLPIPEELQRD